VIEKILKSAPPEYGAAFAVLNFIYKVCALYLRTCSTMGCLTYTIVGYQREERPRGEALTVSQANGPSDRPEGLLPRSRQYREDEGCLFRILC
jgi:hypothetical protein